MSSKVGKKVFGTVPLSVSGKERWDAQGAEHWSSAGEVQDIVQRHVLDMTAALEAVVARNAAIGVSEYLSIGEATLTVDEKGELVIGVRIQNDAAGLIAYIPLKALILTALKEARPMLGVDPQAQALLSQLIGTGRQLAQLGAPAKTHERVPA